MSHCGMTCSRARSVSGLAQKRQHRIFISDLSIIREGGFGRRSRTRARICLSGSSSKSKLKTLLGAECRIDACGAQGWDLTRNDHCALLLWLKPTWSRLHATIPRDQSAPLLRFILDLRLPIILFRKSSEKMFPGEMMLSLSPSIWEVVSPE